jgi:hypothetical protein
MQMKLAPINFNLQQGKLRPNEGHFQGHAADELAKVEFE